MTAGVASVRRQEAVRDLVDAGLVLAHEGLVTAFGHVSVRTGVFDPSEPDFIDMWRGALPELPAIP